MPLSSLYYLDVYDMATAYRIRVRILAEKSFIGLAPEEWI
jgi:hypothetical protein